MLCTLAEGCLNCSMQTCDWQQNAVFKRLAAADVPVDAASPAYPESVQEGVQGAACVYRPEAAHEVARVCLLAQIQHHQTGANLHGSLLRYFHQACIHAADRSRSGRLSEDVLDVSACVLSGASVFVIPAARKQCQTPWLLVSSTTMHHRPRSRQSKCLLTAQHTAEKLTGRRSNHHA